MEEQLDFKLMEKPSHMIYAESDFAIIRGALTNLEALVPSSQKRSKSSGQRPKAKPVGQKVLVESMEKVTSLSKVHSGQSW